MIGRIALGVLLLAGSVVSVLGESAETAAEQLARRPWTETRTGHFNVYSCGEIRDISRVAARLEQFRQAYAVLAGAAAVSSPPIVVMAYPDHAEMEPFLPLYQGRPASMTAFFHHGVDENLIVLPLTGVGTNAMQVIYHEYTHLLLRHNDAFWPLWLKEGMAEIYATFEVTGPHSARIGQPLDRHLSLLAGQPMMPLSELFAVTHDSPQYNESEHQGVFYAESWLLTHYLMLGDNPALKARFGQLTVLLSQGRALTEAFTMAFHVTLPAMDKQLKDYLERGKFEPLTLTIGSDLTASQVISTRRIAPVEIWFHLSDQLMRVGRLESAEACLKHAILVAPKSPLGYEGMGLLAAEADKPDLAVNDLQEALDLGSTSYLAHYTYASERLKLSAASKDEYRRVPNPAATEIRSELQKSLMLMPDFGPAHHLLGFFEMVQGDDLNAAQEHLKRAIQLDPEDESYQLSLAQAQMRANDNAAARRTLEHLRLPYVDEHIRALAADLIKELGQRVDAAPGM